METVLRRFVVIELDSWFLPTQSHFPSRLQELAKNTLSRMRLSNPLIRAMANKKDAQNIKSIRENGLTGVRRSHHSPLDFLLPVQQ